MKKILLLVAFLISVVSCYDDSKLWESIEDHESRISTLEKLCTEMNSNIASLKTIITALQNNDYVTSVTPITENGKEVGYTIEFAKAESITIYHGKDGQPDADGQDGKDEADGTNGKDGQDGSTPVIGVRQDSDGRYYWTLNGEWLLDESGNKIPTTGADGKDVITPQLKIEDKYWYISYDNGATWHQLGKATGEDGAPGADGDLFFQSITQDDEFVHFILADGTVISIPKRISLSVVFDAEDLVVMGTDATRDIRYTVTSIQPNVEVEVLSSSDIKAKAIPDGADSMTGVIRVKTGSEIDEYSKVVVLVSNGEKVIMKALKFEEERIEVVDEAQVVGTAEGGIVELLYLSNVECEVVIPEEAKDWISVEPKSKALEERSVKLLLTANTGAMREATITLQNKDASMKLGYIVTQEPDRDYQLQLEREALIAIYNALDGDNWSRKQNWCSEMPVQYWQGVGANEEGSVVELSLGYNNLKGDLPADVAKLSNLKSLILVGNQLTSISQEIQACHNLEKLDVFINNITSLPKEIGSLRNLKSLSFGDMHFQELPFSLLDFPSLEELIMEAVSFDVFPVEIYTIKTLKKLSVFYQPISPALGNLEKLEYLRVGWAAETTIPSELFNCTRLKSLMLDGQCIGNGTITGPIPDNIGQLLNLEHLIISNANIDNGLPSSMANLKSLTQLELSNCNIGGEFPSDIIMSLENLEMLNLAQNGFTGTISAEFASSDFWRNDWIQICMGNNLDLSKIPIYGPVNRDGEPIVDSRGNNIVLSEIYSNNTYTILYYWDVHCPTVEYLTPMLINLYNDYHSEGVDVISYCASFRQENLDYVVSSGMPWVNLTSDSGYGISHLASVPYVGVVNVVDNEGMIVYNCIDDDPLKLDNWLNKELGDNIPDYTSTDYSQDGVIATLQTATKGKGIDIVLMGDAYSDRQIADGTYKADMENLYNNLFTEEPYRSFKDHFNVYYVNVVSATEGYEYGNTALDGYFGDGTLVGGNDNAVFNYALKAISAEEMDDALLIVAMNSDNYAGTCYMYYPETNADYGKGVSVSYFPKGGDQTTFAQLLHHEANGHGFAKLADEYAYEDMGAVPSDYVSQTRDQQNSWGWWKNVDFTSNPDQVRWSHFLEDDRYANEGLGVFEGGLTYWSGVWRPTEDSIMRYNTGGFNAPSREAIYYRIHKLAYGDSWEYDYEDFVEYDVVNRSTSASAPQKTRRNYVERPLEPTAPPVIVGKSWKDVK